MSGETPIVSAFAPEKPLPEPAEEMTFRLSPIHAKTADDTFTNAAKTRTYGKQFNTLYTYRSNELKSRVLKLAMPKWSNADVNGVKPTFVSKVLDVPFLKPVFIIGTTLADMRFKPDVLKEVELNVQGHFKELKKLTVGADNKDHKIDSLRRSSYSDPKTDKLWLEDESGRILLSGDLLNEKILVTGLVVGVLGMEIESGVFHVVDIVYPEAAPQRAIPAELNKDGKLLLCSGLNIGEKSALASYEMLQSWILGDLGDERAAQICEMLVLGNSVDIFTNEPKVVSEKNKYTDNYSIPFSEQSVEFLDNFFSTLLSSIPITILPGSKDIVEVGLPKQPLHKSLFKQSSNRQNFNRLTDPVFYEINGLRVLATSGENINDIMRYIVPNINVTEDNVDDCIYTDSRLRVIEDSLLWQVIAPTAPDTLWCYPFEDKDPFTLKETPHVYIVGNQPRFETSVIELKRKNGDLLAVRVIALPEFSDSNTCAVLDLKTLNCEVLKIDC